MILIKIQNQSFGPTGLSQEPLNQFEWNLAQMTSWLISNTGKWNHFMKLGFWLCNNPYQDPESKFWTHSWHFMVMLCVIDRQFCLATSQKRQPARSWLILTIWTLRNILVTHTFLDLLPVSLQVPGARCQVRDNSTSKRD